MPFIVWAKENGRPRILTISEEGLATTVVSRRHTFPEFSRLVGKTEAQKALRRYYWEQKNSGPGGSTETEMA